MGELFLKLPYSPASKGLCHSPVNRRGRRCEDEKRTSEEACRENERKNSGKEEAEGALSTQNELYSLEKIRDLT